MSKKKLLICGGTGFIGKNFVEYFSSKDKYDITSTYFRSDPYDAPDIDWIRADLTNKDDVGKVVYGKDIILQMAATTSGAKDIIERPQIHVTDNAIMNSLLLSSVFDNSTPHFIFPSCTVMYNPSETPLKETDFDENEFILPNYFGVGNTKVYIEKMCDFFSRQGRTKHTVLRHSNIYGPHDKFDLERSHVFGATMTKVMTSTNGRINIWGDGTEKRDLLYVADLANFVELAIANQTEAYGLYNVGSGDAISINGLVRKIIDASGKELEMVHDTSKPSIKTSLSLETSKAYNELGWKPATTLDEGIEKTMDWYKNNI
ncbi:MAG: NAD(P)-dependent oxidoreductase [Nanoarchaeota archaeon]|nr:NAD(P)-dependent oxidoreductase [Nanoarchaeota archaeon]